MSCIGGGRCPRKLSRLPTEPCGEGLKAIEAARNGQEAGCPFFVNDAGSNFCAFKYLADNAGRETPEHKIAQLLLISDEAVKKILSNFRRRSSTARAFDE